MMQDRHEETSPSRRSDLPPLAPRDSHTTSSRSRPSASSSGCPARLSNRSRAGCWTCRGRKVKCDEKRPRCGPCARLNRDCDWDHRWNFSDATTTTQSKYRNVTTTGNVVWDPNVSPSPSLSPVSRHHDDLPEFSALTSDEDRERKAETRRPGTYGVVVTPESFSELPEYAGTSPTSDRRLSKQCQGGSIGSPSAAINRTSTQTDPNLVVLERFEDPSTPSSGFSFNNTSPSRRPSIPEVLHRLSISTPPPSIPPTHVAAIRSHSNNVEEPLVLHFKSYIFQRLVQPLLDREAQVNVPSSTTLAFFNEVACFPPLYHAMCAISALNLAYRGQKSLEEALQHYHKALSTSATATTSDDLISDGVFLRHFLLFVYDTCIPTDTGSGENEMWAQHLNHLRQIAVQRHDRLDQEPYGYVMWSICELDMYACLLGTGSCEFFRAIVQHGMLPPLEQQLPRMGAPAAVVFSQDELRIMPTLLHLNQGVMVYTAKLAQVAHQCRAEHAAQRPSASPSAYARWQAKVSQVQNELVVFWNQSWPEFLGPEAPQAGASLPYRARYTVEHALLLYQAAIIYVRTSMFPGQRLIPTANQADIHADTERRCSLILKMSSAYLEAGLMERRHIVFPLLMAGFATTQPDAKIHAINIMTAFQREGGIGQNTYRTRQLLIAICEEQRLVVSAGGRMEQVEWLATARERGLSIVNCGL